MGIVLAAQELKLDLANAEVDLPHGKITLRGANGVERVIPVDADGYFYMDWRLTPTIRGCSRAPIESLLWQDKLRLLGETNGLRDDFRGKLVVVGSAAQGNDLTDRGATPLENDTLLVSKHWNVANSVITGRFIRRASLPVEFALIILLGALTAFLTWQLARVFGAGRNFPAAAGLFASPRFLFSWNSVFGCRWCFRSAAQCCVEHVSLVTYRVVFEEREKRRVKSVFSKIVSPDVVNELLGAEKLSLGGTRREVTVFFADVRGFTTLTDEMQEQVADFVREHQLDLDAAEKCIRGVRARNAGNRESLSRRRRRRGEKPRRHARQIHRRLRDGVLERAGAERKTRARPASRAAIDAQRAIRELNERRAAENAVARNRKPRAAVRRPAAQAAVASRCNSAPASTPAW